MTRRHFRTSEDAEYFFEEGCFILEFFNDPDDPAVSVARARVPPGVTTQPHYLEATTERYLIQAGSGEARIGGSTIKVRPGDVVVIAPGERQQIRNTGEQDLVFLAICTPRFLPANYRTD